MVSAARRGCRYVIHAPGEARRKRRQSQSVLLVNLSRGCWVNQCRGSRSGPLPILLMPGISPSSLPLNTTQSARKQGLGRLPRGLCHNPQVAREAPRCTSAPPPGKGASSCRRVLGLRLAATPGSPEDAGSPIPAPRCLPSAGERVCALGRHTSAPGAGCGSAAEE
ncbi:hypothetical protein NDU88_000859 [Pleurodeles waltl]|uniref:Uncharacterized protein n=1 Tax=Pleurodeles waltl TaxID=8319 RepID=A0AAV7VX82_PLEWA|nr:hypothetical protein NDU88_000859 [Pleurodeles waltl]